MDVIAQLATSLGRRDEVPNQELAGKIAANKDHQSVKELFANLSHKDKNIANDCIKTIYEIGELQPNLIAGFCDELVALLYNKNNRMQWGAMTALKTITDEKPQAIYEALPKIIDAADNGSVITNDNCVAILIKLSANKTYTESAFSLLIERLLASPANQLGMYAENALPIINQKNKSIFITTLNSRLGDIQKESQKVRIEKILRKINKL